MGGTKRLHQEYLDEYDQMVEDLQKELSSNWGAEYDFAVGTPRNPCKHQKGQMPIDRRYICRYCGQDMGPVWR